MDRPRKTLRQLSAEATNPRDPWACRCGCKKTEVVRTALRGGVRRRERRCLDCGEPMDTLEIPVPPGMRLVVIPETEVA
jgi:hypothetical protein